MILKVVIDICLKYDFLIGYMVIGIIGGFINVEKNYNG